MSKLRFMIASAFLLLIIGPFLFFGNSLILAKAPALVFGIVLGLIIVYFTWRLIKRFNLLDEENKNEQG